MPIIDMPLSDLYHYTGTNPRPEDFDLYWEYAIKEMKAVDPSPVLIPSDFQVPGIECFDLYFTSTKNARIHAKYLRPSNATNCPVILQFHGYTGSSGDWSDKVNYPLLGFAVAVLDCRGQAGLSEDTGHVKGNTHHGHIIRGLSDEDPHHLLFRDIFLDTAKLADVIMSFAETDPNRVCAMGGSQGGGLTIACAALVPNIKLAIPMYPFLSDYKRVWEMDLAKNAYEELVTYFRFFDPRHEQEDSIFTKLGYIDVQNLAPRIQGQVYMFTGLMDSVCPPSTQFAAYNKMTCKKEIVIYPDFGHEFLPQFSDMAMQYILKKL